MAETGTAPRTQGTERSSEEGLLLQYLKRIEENRTNVYAVEINLSELRAGNRHPQFLRIASRLLESITLNYDASLFGMANRDLILVCRDVPVDDVDSVIAKVRALFSEDPLAVAEAGSLDDRFATWHDLSQREEFGAFTAKAGERAAAAAEAQKKAALGGPQSAAAGEPLDPGNLAAINQKLKETGIADLIHQQPAVLIHSVDRGEVLFREYFVSMAELGQRIAPGVDLFANPWLFQYLTETLDRRMLAVVARRGFDQVEDAISLNLNIGTLLSQDFQQFHRLIGGNAKRIVVEVQLINVFADLAAFSFARDALRERGYRVLVDGLTPLTLQFFDPSQLGADFVKIAWGREFMGEVPDDRLVEMRDVVKHTGKERVILARVDSESAVRWGLSLGLARFQGRFVDRLMEAMAARRKQARG